MSYSSFTGSVGSTDSNDLDGTSEGLQWRWGIIWRCFFVLYNTKEIILVTLGLFSMPHYILSTEVFPLIYKSVHDLHQQDFIPMRGVCDPTEYPGRCDNTSQQTDWCRQEQPTSSQSISLSLQARWRGSAYRERADTIQYATLALPNASFFQTESKQWLGTLHLESANEMAVHVEVDVEDHIVVGHNQSGRSPELRVEYIENSGIRFEEIDPSHGHNKSLVVKIGERLRLGQNGTEFIIEHRDTTFDLHVFENKQFGSIALEDDSKHLKAYSNNQKDQGYRFNVISSDGLKVVSPADISEAKQWCQNQCFQQQNCTGFGVRLSNPCLWACTNMNDWLVAVNVPFDLCMQNCQQVGSPETCTLWFGGSCHGITSPGFAPTFDNKLLTYAPEIAVKLNTVLPSLIWFYGNHWVIYRYAPVMGVFLDVACAGCFIVLSITIFIMLNMLFSCSAFGTFQFYQNIVTIKKGMPLKIMLWLCALLCGLAFFIFAGYWFKGVLLDHWILLTPIAVGLNVLDLRRPNEDMYPRLEDDSPLFLKLSLISLTYTAEDVLEVVENGVIANKFSHRTDPLNDFVAADDVERILSSFESFGQNEEISVSCPVYLGGRSRCCYFLLGLLGTLLEYKGFILVCYSYQQIANVYFGMLFDHEFRRIVDPYSSDYAFMYWWYFATAPGWVYLLVMMFVGYFANSFAYGSFEYFVRVVSLKKDAPLFKRFPLAMLIAGLVWWLWLGPYWLLMLKSLYGWEAVRSFWGLTWLPVLRLVINVLLLRKVTEDLYPQGSDEKTIFLKLSPFDIATQAEWILERLENAFLAYKMGEHKPDLDSLRHLEKCIDIPEDLDALDDVYKNFGSDYDSEDTWYAFWRNLCVAKRCIAIWFSLSIVALLLAALFYYISAMLHVFQRWLGESFWVDVLAVTIAEASFFCFIAMLDCLLHPIRTHVVALVRGIEVTDEEHAASSDDEQNDALLSTGS